MRKELSEGNERRVKFREERVINRGWTKTRRERGEKPQKLMLNFQMRIQSGGDMWKIVGFKGLERVGCRVLDSWQGITPAVLHGYADLKASQSQLEAVPRNWSQSAGKMKTVKSEVTLEKQTVMIHLVFVWLLFFLVVHSLFFSHLFSHMEASKNMLTCRDLRNTNAKWRKHC